MQPEDAQLDTSVSIQAVVVFTGSAGTAQACGLLFGFKVSYPPELKYMQIHEDILESQWTQIVIKATLKNQLNKSNQYQFRDSYIKKLQASFPKVWKTTAEFKIIKKNLKHLKESLDPWMQNIKK